MQIISLVVYAILPIPSSRARLMGTVVMHVLHVAEHASRRVFQRGPEWMKGEFVTRAICTRSANNKRSPFLVRLGRRLLHWHWRCLCRRCVGSVIVFPLGLVIREWWLSLKRVLVGGHGWIQIKIRSSSRTRASQRRVQSRRTDQRCSA